MEENFNMRKIHAGYVVEFRNRERALAMRYDNGNAGDNLVFLDPDTDCLYGPAKHWDSKTLLHTREPLRGRRADHDIPYLLSTELTNTLLRAFCLAARQR